MGEQAHRGHRPAPVSKRLSRFFRSGPLRADHGWHVKARRGGWDGVEVAYNFTSETDAHAML
jgi:hypothetical protein